MTDLTTAEMKKLESALKKILVIRVDDWVYVRQDGNTHNGSVVAFEKGKVRIKYQNGDVPLISRKLVSGAMTLSTSLMTAKSHMWIT